MASLRRSTLLTTPEAAALLRLKPHTLENMRGDGRGPIHSKFGGRVFYRHDDLKEYCEKARRRSTSGQRP